MGWRALRAVLHIPKNTLHGACGRAVFHENEIIKGLPARLLGPLGGFRVWGLGRV